MPNKCCVPNCKSNLKNGPYIPMFSFPKQNDRLSLWLKKIPRANLKVTKTTRVCVEHLREDFVIRNHEVTNKDGKDPLLFPIYSILSLSPN